jgi:hypothetical protein
VKAVRVGDVSFAACSNERCHEIAVVHYRWPGKSPRLFACFTDWLRACRIIHALGFDPEVLDARVFDFAHRHDFILQGAGEPCSPVEAPKARAHGSDESGEHPAGSARSAPEDVQSAPTPLSSVPSSGSEATPPGCPRCGALLTPEDVLSSALALACGLPRVCDACWRRHFHQASQ